MSLRTISQRELRNESGEIMRAVEAGETFVITSNGRPVATLAPLNGPIFSKTADVLKTFLNAPKIDFEAFRRDIYEGIDDSVEPRG